MVIESELDHIASEPVFVRTGPGTPAGKFMRSFWQPVALARTVTPGQKIPIKIMGEELMVYRGESGEAHVVAGRCAHRNALLSLGVVEDDCIRCFYHGWLYDSTGQCIEQVLERPNFARQIHIASYPVYEYLGLIFAYLGEGEPPPVPYYPEYDEGVVVSVRETYHPFNYYQSMENSVDPLHVPYVHRQSSHFAAAGTAQYRGGLDGMVADLLAEETEWGFTIRTTYDNGNCRVTNFEMPTVIHFTIPPSSCEVGWPDAIGWKIPVDDTGHIVFLMIVARLDGELADEYRADPRSPFQTNDTERQAQQFALHEIGDTIIAGTYEMTVDDVGEVALTQDLQDYVVQRGQGLIVDRSSEHLGRSDQAISLMRRLWTREIAKLEAGESRKDWRWPGFVEAPTGVVDAL